MGAATSTNTPPTSQEQDHRMLSVAYTPEYPGDNCCILFDEPNWEEGSSLTLCRDPNLKTQLFDLHDYDFDNKASSGYCGKNVAYDFCDNGPDKTCDRIEGNRGAGNDRSAQIEFNNSVTSVYLSEYDPQEQPAAILFSDNNCTGRFGRFFAPNEHNISNDYRETEIKNFEGGNYNAISSWNIDTNSMTSLKVPYGLTIELYDSDSF